MLGCSMITNPFHADVTDGHLPHPMHLEYLVFVPSSSWTLTLALGSATLSSSGLVGFSHDGGCGRQPIPLPHVQFLSLYSFSPSLSFTPCSKPCPSAMLVLVTPGTALLLGYLGASRCTHSIFPFPVPRPLFPTACCCLDLKCPPKAHVAMAWPACNTLGG